MKKQKITAILLACALMVGCQSAKEKEQEQIEAAYALNLNSVATEMLVGAALSEKMCNNVSKVWHDAIFDENNLETSKYMRDKETFEKVDFNGALANYYADEATISTVNSIEDNKEKVDDLMSDLSMPPEKYTTCYDTITDMYKQYSEFTSLAISPTGSYKDYSNNFMQIDKDFMSTYDLVKTQLPDTSSSDISD